eukprot:scaffold16043_cov115-Isochrysis_galbana.AAC.11
MRCEKTWAPVQRHCAARQDAARALEVHQAHRPHGCASHPLALVAARRWEPRALRRNHASSVSGVCQGAARLDQLYNTILVGTYGLKRTLRRVVPGPGVAGVW